MESTEKCDAVISHFNGKFIKIPAGVPGETCIIINIILLQSCVHITKTAYKMIDCNLHIIQRKLLEVVRQLIHAFNGSR